MAIALHGKAQLTLRAAGAVREQIMVRRDVVIHVQPVGMVVAVGLHLGGYRGANGGYGLGVGWGAGLARCVRYQESSRGEN
jgi:hypothetical protein